MMRNELEDRLGYPLEDWQWKIAEKVYMDHHNISNTHGKDQIAGIIRMGFEYPFSRIIPLSQGKGWSGRCDWELVPIMQMYKECGGQPIICKTNRFLTYTEDVTTDGYCINFRPNKIKEVSQEILDLIKKKNPDLIKGMDYWSPCYDYRDRENATFPDKFPRIAVFYVEGGSEGYYVHVEALHDGKHDNIFLAKTLREGEAGITWAEQMVCTISRIMDV